MPALLAPAVATPPPAAVPASPAPALVLSNLSSSSITRSGATVTWTTNTPSTSWVEFGPTPTYGSRTPTDSALLTTHTVVLDGLQPGTTYHFRADSTALGGPAGASVDGTFTTAPSGTGPEVLGLSVLQMTSTTALVGWTSPTGIVAQVDYGQTANYGSFTLLQVFSTPTQQMALSNLTANTQYHVRVKAWDGAGDLGASGDLTFTTPTIGAATLLGTQQVAPIPVVLPPGRAAAYQYVASQSGLASRVRVYVDTGNTSTLLRAALYADQAGAPGAILAQGSIVPALGWNTIALPPTFVLAGGRYWVAVLSPAGALATRQAAAPGSASAGPSNSASLQSTAVGGSQLSLQSTLAAFPATWTPGVPGAAESLAAYVQQMPPSVSVTGLSNDSTVSGIVRLSAVVDDDNPVTLVQFLVDNIPVGVATHAPFALAWDSSTVRGNTPHVVTARATDALGRTASSAPVTLGVDNGPLILNVVAEPGLTASSARVRWTSSVPSDSQVEYGATTAYGLSTPLQVQPTTVHEQQLTGLSPGTTYHLRVRGRDANGAAATSADVTFTTPATPTTPDASDDEAPAP